MKITFDTCLKKKRIFVFPQAKELVGLELEDSFDDLNSAKEELSRSSYKWATIKGYYAMFHAARGLLYAKGYREKGHYCLYLAIKELYVKENILEAELAEKFYNSMILREDADYRRKFSEKTASRVVQAANVFFNRTKEILNL